MKVLAPLRTHWPDPDFVSEVAPVLLPITAARVLAPVFDPVRVKVRAEVEPLNPMLPVLVKLTAPDPEASIVPLLPPIEKRRSVLTVAPVYLKVPPSITRFVAALLEAPMLLLLPPAAKVLAESVPPLMVVPPSYVLLAFEREVVPEPAKIKPVPEVPETTPLKIMLPEVWPLVIVRVAAPKPVAAANVALPVPVNPISPPRVIPVTAYARVPDV